MRKKHSWKSFKAFSKVVILLVSLLMFSACSGDNGGGVGFGGGKVKESAEDTPWNHGLDAIMETENGYYSNMMMSQSYMQSMCLRYYDKETGTTMLLCNKPECMHDGSDACEATYKNVRVIHTAMYEGSLYVYGAETWEGMISLNLYRAALDGSSVDKVGTVLSAEQAEDESGVPQQVTIKQPDAFDEMFSEVDYSFIIHKGQAYLPYFLRFGKGMAGFQGGGLAKMDLKTGKTNMIYELENMSQGVPGMLTAKGDYVWFRLYKNYKGSRVKRYNVAEDKVEDFYGFLADYPDSQMNLMAPIPGEDRVYDFGYVMEGDKEALRFQVYDIKTGECYPEETIVAELDHKVGGRFSNVFLYDNKLFVADVFGIFAYDTQGNKLAELPLPEDQLGIKLNRRTVTGGDNQLKQTRYKISDGKVYLLFWDSRDVRYQTGGYGYRKRVFSCPMEEFYAGNGKWTEVFTIEGYVVQTTSFEEEGK